MPKPYMVRINFPRQVVTINKGTKNEFKTSIMDVYYDSLEDARSFYPKTNDTVDLTNVYGYNKLIWQWENRLGIWAYVSSEPVMLK